MATIYRNISIAAVSIGLVLTTGCVSSDGTANNTGTDAIIGGITGAALGGLLGGRHAIGGAVIGGVAGAAAGALVGHMIDDEQRQRLQQQSPQTWQVIQNNDAVYNGQQAAQAQASPAQTPPQQLQTSPQPAPSQNPTYTPLTVDDIKAIAAAGVKNEAITKEIDISQSKYSPQDIALAQQANVDPSVIACMRSHSS